MNWSKRLSCLLSAFYANKYLSTALFNKYSKIGLFAFTLFIINPCAGSQTSWKLQRRLNYQILILGLIFILILLAPSHLSLRLFAVVLLSVSIWKIIISYNHILLLLLTLELFALTLFFLIILGVFFRNIAPSTLFTFLTLIVCEARTGLALLIRFTRAQGSQALNYLFFFKLN